ncbi:MAG: GMP synthase [Spirochaetes bacterium GWD1_27_9]|nr:MAG: GMP synthase [Spirochaetes bacterium GWB1_27_13]OHD26179.1 MAG: GMP synthase [Spirochaetes bacterium GWC1_27_15]OHD37617.1 MAG: GMP synthase [Spirochaetes bacterium GWD1_27_9]
MEKILVLDFGGQYAHLIARRFRNLGFYSEIALPSIEESKITKVAGIVLSGGPSSVYEKDKPHFNSKILNLNIPILGLCYGHQLLNLEYGGKVEQAKIGEFGFASFEKVKDSPMFEGVESKSQVWMSHSDEVTEIPTGFEVIGSTKDCKYTAVQNLNLKRFGFQFHAEVKDTPIGDKIFANFAKFCGMPKNWDSSKVLALIKKEIIHDAKDKNVLLFLSGGVDSSVAFALLNETLGQQRVMGLYINNGFMRKNETEKIKDGYEKLGYKNFMIEDATETFLKAVEGLTDPQQKRKAVGETFLKIRNEVVTRLNLDEDNWLLGQGTLYPDIIESGGTKHSHTIKTHHNRVDGIQQLIEKGLIIEPLKELYKDEVRVIGKAVGLPDEIVFRHPFPGPGLSINVLCSDGKLSNQDEFLLTKDKLKSLDLSSFLKNNYEIYPLPVKSVGVQGDFRTYRFPATLKIENLFENFIGWDNLEKISSFITNNINTVNRTIIEIFNKKECNLQFGYCTKDRLDITREVDAIVIEELKKSGWYQKIFQHLTINLPYSYDEKSSAIVLRPVISEDVMTARFANLDLNLLKTIVDRIYKLSFVDALYYDITNKPPATFGWE